MKTDIPTDWAVPPEPSSITIESLRAELAEARRIGDAALRLVRALRAERDINASTCEHLAARRDELLAENAALSAVRDEACDEWESCSEELAINSEDAEFHEIDLKRIAELRAVGRNP